MAGSKDNSHAKRRKGGSTISSSSHIRFGQEEDSDAYAKPAVSNEQKSPTEGGALPVTSTTSASTSSDNQQQKKNKRKRKHTSSSKDKNEEEDNTKDTSSSSSLSSCNKIFNGLIIAISTLESKKNNTTTPNTNTNTTATTTTTNNNAKEDADNDDLYQNYKTLKHHLQTNLGATISPQVHKRVHYLISTQCAVQNLTQRVRQAYKRNVDIVDVAWVKDCIQQKKRVDVNVNNEYYLRNEMVKCLMEEKKEREKKERSAVVVIVSKKSAATMEEEEEGKVSNIDHNGNHCDSDSDDVVPEEDNEGWSTPIQLDCCCVCHENGDLNCPWCTGKGNECNLTLARMANNVCLPVKL